MRREWHMGMAGAGLWGMGGGGGGRGEDDVYGGHEAAWTAFFDQSSLEKKFNDDTKVIDMNLA